MTSLTTEIMLGFQYWAWFSIVKKALHQIRELLAVTSLTSLSAIEIFAYPVMLVIVMIHISKLAHLVDSLVFSGNISWFQKLNKRKRLSGPMWLEISAWIILYELRNNFSSLTRGKKEAYVIKLRFIIFYYIIDSIIVSTVWFLFYQAKVNINLMWCHLCRSYQYFMKIFHWN